MAIDLAGLLGSVAVIASTSGLVSAAYAAWLHRQAERQLIEEIRKEQQRIEELQALQAELESEDLDPEKLAKGREIILHAADSLSMQRRRDIASTLNQGSDRSRANYIVKLITEASSRQTTLLSPEGT